MKREFLQNLDVGGQSLPKEVIDAILDEYGKDIAKVKAEAAKPLADQQALRAENQRLAQLVEQVRFQALLDSEIVKAKGRNAKAITALLDVEALRTGDDPTSAVRRALEALKQEQDYLFFRDVPPYAPGTGTNRPENNYLPVDLAGAIREKMERK